MQTPAARAMLNETFGLDKPLVVRYLHFIGNLAVGDLGVDFERRRPVFVTGIVLRNTLSGVPVFGWEAFPLIPRSIGVETTWLQNLVLPAVTLGVGALAYTVTLARGAMLDVLAADYIRTARAKGLTERKIVFKHAARNAMIPVAELSAMQLGALMGGTSPPPRNQKCWLRSSKLCGCPVVCGWVSSRSPEVTVDQEQTFAQRSTDR